jgi:hypothetical protein
MPGQGVFETRYSDNEARLGTELRATALATEVLPGGVRPQVQIERHGLPYTVPVTASLRLDDPNGPLIGAATIRFPDSPTAPVTATTWIPSNLISPGRHLIFWDIDPNQRLGERDRSDNQVVTAVRIAPDLESNPLMIAWDQTPGTSKAINMVVQNSGNAPSTPSVAAIWTGVPGQVASREIGRVTIPVIAAGESAVLTGTLNLTGLPEAAKGITSVYIQLDATDVLEEINENNNLLMIGGVVGGLVNQPATGYKVYLPTVQR